jgi:large subunit ribosomal protein L10
VKRQEKERIVEQIREKLAPCDVAVLTRFSGLKVSEINRLRMELKKISVDYHVVKNSLVKRALEGTDIALLVDHFQGPLAIALSRGDIVPVAKLLTGYMREHPKEVERAATLPSREELVAKLLFLMNAPLIQFMNVLKGVLGQLIRTLAAIRKQKEAAESHTP